MIEEGRDYSLGSGKRADGAPEGASTAVLGVRRGGAGRMIEEGRDYSLGSGKRAPRSTAPVRPGAVRRRTTTGRETVVGMRWLTS